MSDLIRITQHRSEGVYVGSFGGHPAAWTSVPEEHHRVCEASFLVDLFILRLPRRALSRQDEA